MNQSEALSLVRSLANGVDPESGEVFAADSVYQRAQTVRALYAAAEALEKSERFERRKQQLPPKTGEPWTEDEDRKLLSGFDAGRGLPDLADVARVDRVVAVNPHETQRAELLQHLTQRADVAQRTRATQPHVRLVSLRLEEVDVVRVDDPAQPSRKVKQGLAAREGHSSFYLPQAWYGWE